MATVVALAGSVVVVDRKRGTNELTFAQGSDARYTCGGIGPSFPVDAIFSPLGAENADDPATAVLRGHTTPENSPYVESKGWRQLARTDDEVIWATGPEFGYYGVKRDGDSWRFAYSGGTCRFTRVRPEGLTEATWVLAGELDPDATSIDVLVAHDPDSGLNMAPPVVELRDHAVQIALSRRLPPARGDAVTIFLDEREPEYSPYTVEIGEPIRGRTVVDGGYFPALPAATGRPRPEYPCGIAPMHVDELEVAAGTQTRVWPATHCESAGTLQFSLLTDGRQPERPLVNAPAGPKRRNRRAPYVITIPPDASPGPAAIIARGTNCGLCVVESTPVLIAPSGAPAEASPTPAASEAANPTAEERVAGKVRHARSLDDIRILPPPDGASPKVTRKQAWEKLRQSPGAAANADESWVLLADYSAATPAEDPDMDGQDTVPAFQHRLVWVLFQFRVPNEVAAHGPCCQPTPRREAEFMDVVTGVDALTGDDIGVTSHSYFA